MWLSIPDFRSLFPYFASTNLPPISRTAMSRCTQVGKRNKRKVPPGHVAVYAGEKEHERTRFVIKTACLRHPLFKALLNKTAEEMGFHHEGALAVPCEAHFFEFLLNLIHLTPEDDIGNDVVEILTFYSRRCKRHENIDGNGRNENAHFYDLICPQHVELLKDLLESSIPHHARLPEVLNSFFARSVPPSVCKHDQSITLFHVSTSNHLPSQHIQA
ncbi:hypothetical protein KP509_12G086400 [Ceratopteris richardii]|uniref:Uncharacterized protein n=1 Tax=Ceratopteris richardii TaxID=49495 RepID=A0A8T2TQN0_CERRI|nr:hypothetical protein KP509_12G086400 [Ceratopteris richardii]